VSDEELRRLERAWAESKTRQARRALLEARRRAGLEPPDRGWSGRIWFPGNPWPEGHELRVFGWAGRLSAEGISFDFSLESADYYDEDEEPDDEDDDEELDDEDEEGPDWEARIAWENYHAASISSDGAEGLGVPISTPLDPSALAGTTLVADPLPVDLDDHDQRAFWCYILGHDSVADHRFEFTREHLDGSFDLTWTGRIALTYVGDDELRYTFRAELKRAPLMWLSVPVGTSAEDARGWLERHVSDPGAFSQRAAGGTLVFDYEPLGPAG